MIKAIDVPALAILILHELHDGTPISEIDAELKREGLSDDEITRVFAQVEARLEHEADDHALHASELRTFKSQREK